MEKRKPPGDMLELEAICPSSPSPGPYIGAAAGQASLPREPRVKHGSKRPRCDAYELAASQFDHRPGEGHVVDQPPYLPETSPELGSTAQSRDPPVSHHGIYNISSDNNQEEYNLTPSQEEDFVGLAEMAVLDVDQPSGLPPSSVIRGMDSISSDEVYDTNLRGSTPNKPSADVAGYEDEDPLDDEVVWDEVFVALPNRPQDPSLPGSLISKVAHPNRQAQSSGTVPKLTQTTTGSPRPFVRPRFPDPVRDKSPIAGLSSATKLRTCFRIGEMLNQAKKVSASREDVIFELYARVAFSSREELQRAQYFRFMDLYAHRQPQPGGKLDGWRSASLLDQQSLVLVTNDTTYPKEICRCLCRIIRDTKTTIGWSLDILTIRESDWGEVELMRQLTCGG